VDAVGTREYWENRLRESFGLESVGYLGLGRRYNQWLYRVRRRVFLRKLGNLALDPGSARVLDVGSGTGFYIERWEELGIKRIVGSDITEVSVQALERRHPGHEFVQLDIGGDLGSLTGARFDVISAFDVLFHIVDDAHFMRALLNIHSMLEPGGWFVFSDNFLHRETVRTARQVSRSLGEIESALVGSGFEIVERAPMFALMNYPIDSQSALARRVWQMLAGIISAHELIGFLVGAGLYPLELLCVRLVREGPSTEMMICRRK
jgi:SAM-dependent methyltransferase